jgi:hypothetical protein
MWRSQFITDKRALTKDNIDCLLVPSSTPYAYGPSGNAVPSGTCRQKADRKDGSPVDHALGPALPAGQPTAKR